MFFPLLEAQQGLTIGAVALSSLDANLCDGTDDGAVGAPLTDQIHDLICDFLDEGYTSLLVLCRLKYSAESHHYGPTHRISVPSNHLFMNSRNI